MKISYSKTVLSFLILSFSCFGQSDSITNKSKINFFEIESMFKQSKPEKKFPYNPDEDFVVIKIDNKLYSANYDSLLFQPHREYSIIPPYNVVIKFYRNKRLLFESPFILENDIKNPNPKIFKKVFYKKKIFDNEDSYLTKLKKIKSAYVIEHNTNNYFKYLEAYIPMKYKERSYWVSKLRSYRLEDYYNPEGEKLFKNEVKNKTINYNNCKFYFSRPPWSRKKVLSGYNPVNERIYLSEFRIYFDLNNQDCADKFDAKTISFFHKKHTDIYIKGEHRNDKYILEWYKY